MVLVIVEHQKDSIKKTFGECLGVAHQLAEKLGGDVHAAIIGHELKAVSSQIDGYPIKKLHMIDSPQLAKATTEKKADALAPLVKGGEFKAVIASSSVWGRDLTARLAAKIPCGLVTDCTELHWDGDKPIFYRPVYAGKAFANVAFNNGIIMATLRPNVFPPIEPSNGSFEKGIITYDAQDGMSKLIEIISTDTGEIELTEADVIVSGGRGLKGPENWGMLKELVDVLGAALGASRAVVDAGWIDHSHQVGQTGKTVSPKLYIACGISGAIQHLAGMSSSKVIVAINNNPEAPIFKYATFGIVGDMFKVIPLLTEEIKKLLN